MLQTIGLGIISRCRRCSCCTGAAPHLLIAIALWAYALFSVSFAQVTAWLATHPTLGRIFLFEFAPWPWISLVWIGLALGWTWALQDTPARRARYLTIMSAVGVVFLALFVAWDWAHGAAAPVARLQARLHPEQSLDLARGHEPSASGRCSAFSGLRTT